MRDDFWMAKRPHYIARACGNGPFVGNSARLDEQNITVWYDTLNARIVSFGAGRPAGKHLETMSVCLDANGLPLPSLNCRTRTPNGMELKLLRDIEAYREYLKTEAKEQTPRMETKPLF